MKKAHNLESNISSQMEKRDIYPDKFWGSKSQYPAIVTEQEVMVYTKIIAEVQSIEVAIETETTI